MFNCTKSLAYWKQFKNNQLVQDVALGFVVLGILTSVLVIFTNFAVIYTLAKKRSLQTLPNFLILALAIGDFLVGVVVQPPYIARGIVIYNRTFDQLCLPAQVFGFLGWTFFPITSLHLTVLTLDRFFALRFHLRYNELFTRKSYCVVFIFIWLYGLACGTVYIVRRDLILYTLSVFFMCNFLTFFCILNIVFTVRRLSAQIASHQQPDASSSSSSFLNMPRLKKSISTIYFVVAAFVLCHIPYLGFIVWEGLKLLDAEDLRITAIVSQYIVVLNSFINPVMYFWRIRELRKSALQVMFGWE